MENKRRVVITGMGVISPVGIGIQNYWDSLVHGRSGIGLIKRFDTQGFPCRLAAESDFDPLEYLERREARKLDRFAQFAIVASRLAVEDASVKGHFNPERSGVIIGTGVGGMEAFHRESKTLMEKGPTRVSPFFIPMMIANMASGQVSMDLNLKGPINTTVTACASATNAIGDAFNIIRHGYADMMVTGGSEAPIVPLALAGFSSMKALSTRNDLGSRACQPFDKKRDGFIMGEGSGILVLEEVEHALNRGAKIYGEIVGYGMSSDAYHVTAPAPMGEGAVRAMKAAVVDAGAVPENIDYVNAHGTSTPANDANETQAIKTLLGERAAQVPVSSTKSMLGHLLGAAGAVEAIATVLTINHKVIPPTINYEDPDPICDLDYVPNKARSYEVNLALKNSFGFGGQNACLMIAKYQG